MTMYSVLYLDSMRMRRVVCIGGGLVQSCAATPNRLGNAARTRAAFASSSVSSARMATCNFQDTVSHPHYIHARAHS
eukprot:scaffold60431_cov35-Tisochrysis_lutea.AAC.4